MAHFIRTSGFDRLVAAGRVHAIPGTPHWFPAFRDSDTAMSFGLFVATAYRRIGRRMRTHVAVHKMPTGFVAACDLAIWGFGVETGLIACSGGNSSGFGGQAEGIYVREHSTRVLFPIREPRFTAVTETGTRYLGFTDGTAFARSKDGPLSCAVELCFAYDSRQADDVHRKGGHIMVSDVPSVGMTPIYATRRSTPLSQSCRQFTAGTFRRGTPVGQVFYWT